MYMYLPGSYSDSAMILSVILREKEFIFLNMILFYYYKLKTNINIFYTIINM